MSANLGFGPEELRFAHFMTTLSDLTYLDMADEFLKQQMAGPAFHDAQGRPICRHYHHIVEVLHPLVLTCHRSWPKDQKVKHCKFNEPEIENDCRAWLLGFWKASPAPRFGSIVERVWSRYRSPTHHHIGTQFYIPSFDNGRSKWLFHQWLLWLLRTETIQIDQIDITEPRTWPDKFRSSFLEELNTTRKFSATLTDPEFKTETDRFRYAVEASVYAMNEQKDVPRNKDFDSAFTWHAVHQFIKWGYIRGEYADEYIKLDGDQLDIAENMKPGKEKDQICARKEQRRKDGDRWI